MPTTPRHPLNKRIPDRCRPANAPADTELVAFARGAARAVDVYAQAITETALLIAESLAPVARQITQAMLTTVRAGHRQALNAARDEYTLAR